MNTLPPHLQPPGRGAKSNAASRFESVDRVAIDDGWRAEQAKPSQVRTRVTPLTSRTIISKNTSPDLSFDRTINPYKGCEHGCIYCYARPAHAYLGLSPGLDFETEIFSKPNAAHLLEKALGAPGYRPQCIMIGGDTDPYQPIERELKSTRAILKVLARARHPLAIITKSGLIERDLDILAPMAAQGLAKAAVSITTLDPKLARDMEPRAATPRRRLDAVRALSQAGVPTRVMAAPMIPGLTDHELEAILSAGKDAGAVSAGYILLRLPREIATLFEEWLHAARPGAAARVLSLVRQSRGGRAYQSDWYVRGRGTGPVADALRARFDMAARRLGLNTPQPALRTDLFQAPSRGGQLTLFDPLTTEDPPSHD